MSISSIVQLLDLTQNTHNLRLYRYFCQMLWPTGCPRVAVVPAELRTRDLKKTPNGVQSADELERGVADCHLHRGHPTFVSPTVVSPTVSLPTVFSPQRRPARRPPARCHPLFRQADTAR